MTGLDFLFGIYIVVAAWMYFDDLKASGRTENVEED